MANKPTISLQDLKEYLSYDPADGSFRYRKPSGRGGRYPAGTIIAGGKTSEGYRSIRINGVMYRASRLAWFYMTGEWPPEQVDHKDHNTSNDAWDNLRLATQSQNKANCRAYKKKSCTLKGVQAVQKKHSIRYRAVVTKDGVRRNLGNFDTEIEAHLAYVKAAEMLHGDFAFAGTEAAGHG